MTRCSLLLGLVGLLGAQACIGEEIPEPGTNAPDLYVKSLALSPATPTQGQPVTVTVTIGNQGGAAAQEASIVEWYGGEAFPTAGCNWTIGGQGAAAIGPGQEVTVRCTYAGYASWYGNINTKVEVDATDVIDEGGAAAEANNSYLRPISVAQGTPPGPDLFVRAFTLTPAVPVQGQPVNVSVTIGNQGNAPVPVGPVAVRWFGGENFAAPGCEWTIARTAPIAPGSSETVQCTYSGFLSWYANINTKVEVDVANAVAEPNETNNTYLQPISVSRP